MKYEVSAIKDKDSQWIELFVEGENGWVVVEMSTEIAKGLAEEIDVACTRLNNKPNKEILYSKNKVWWG